MALLQWTAVSIVQYYETFLRLDWPNFSMNIVKRMCGFSKMLHHSTHIYLVSWERCFLDMFPLYMVILGNPHICEIWHTLNFFLGCLKSQIYQYCPQTLGIIMEANTVGNCCHYAKNVSQSHGKLLRMAQSIMEIANWVTLFKMISCKTALCVLSKNKANILYLFGLDFISFPNWSIFSGTNFM